MGAPDKASTPRLENAQLRGERVLLRPVCSGDAGRAFSLLHGCDEILRWLLWDGPASAAELEESYSSARRQSFLRTRVRPDLLPLNMEINSQFMYPGANFDFWDSHRDMIVRDRILNHNLLSFEAMNAFGKRGIGNESIYNQGFLFCSWMVEKYGMDVLKNITKSISNPLNYSINHAIRDATGIWGYELYDKWKDELIILYSKKTAHIHEFEEKGAVLISTGTTNIHPVWSPDENRFAYLSNQEHDNFGQTDLFYYDFLDSTSQKIDAGIYTAPSWINDSTIIYTKRSKPNKWGSKFFDLYIYTFNDAEEERVTHDSEDRLHPHAATPKPL